jgi:hypothetical protein
VFEKKLDVLGHYRFAPGKWIPNSAPLSAPCFRINGVLPARWVKQEGGGALLQDTLHTYKSIVDEDDPCEWGDLNKLF